MGCVKKFRGAIQGRETTISSGHLAGFKTGVTQ
jgi:hypothetical protein